MNNGPDHLNEQSRAVLELSDAERISRVRRTRWIGYTRAQQILDKLNELLTHPKTHRMPNLLIVGDTNNGKTTLVQKFQRLHPPSDNPEGDFSSYPVLIVQSPPMPDESRFYHAILERVGAPYNPKSSVEVRQHQVITILKNINVKMLVIDEIHDILAGSPIRQRQFRNTLKYLGNELQIPIVGVGIKESFHVMQTDQQMSNRFEPALLPKWEFGQEYLSLLSSFELMLPLRKPSRLVEKTLALKLLSMSEGTIGALSSVLTKASIKAIESRAERITLKILGEIGWVQPSERKWSAAANG